MTEKSFYWPESGGGDGGTTYSDDEFSDNWRYMLMQDRTTQGVIRGVLSDLEVSGDVSPVTLATGAALVDGKIYINDANLDLSVSTPSSDPRKDLLVLRKDWSAQTIRATVIEGTEGSGSYPSITQTDGSVWDIILAKWNIDTGGNITIVRSKGDFVVSKVSLLQTLLGESPADGKAPVSDSGVDLGMVFRTMMPLDNRQGGDAGKWEATGTTNYSPGDVRVEVGSILVSDIPAGGFSDVAANFSISFANNPIAFATLFGDAGATLRVFISSVNSGFMTIKVQNDGAAEVSVDVFWMAIGPR